MIAVLLLAQALAYTKTGTLFVEGAFSPVELYRKEFGGFVTAGVHLERDLAVQLKGTVRQSVKPHGLDENSRALELRYSPYFAQSLGLHVEGGFSQLFARDHEEFDEEECVKYRAEGPSFGAGWSKTRNESTRLGVSFLTAMVPRKERKEPCGEGQDFYREYGTGAVVTSYISGTVGVLF